MNNFTPGVMPGPHKGQKCINRWLLEDFKNPFKRLVGIVIAFLTERLLQDRLAKILVLVFLLLTDEAANTRPCLPGNNKPFPGRIRRLRL